MNPLTVSYLHSGGGEPLLGATIPEHLSQVVRDNPENEAVVDLVRKRRLTYRELAKATDKLAKGLCGLGFKRGDRIGIWSTNNIEWLLLQLATARLGIILVNINPAYRTHELSYALKKSEVQAVFAIPAFRSSDYVKMLLEIMPELSEIAAAEWSAGAFREFPLLEQVVIYDPGNLDLLERPAPGMMLWREVLAAGGEIDDGRLDDESEKLDRDDPINIQYTSGTTGFPKAVLLSHHNILNNAWAAGELLSFTAKDRLCVPVPFYHCFGMVLANLLCLARGATIVIACDHFDPLQVLRAIESERCTALHGVPTMFIAELEHPEFKNIDTTSLRTGIMAGAACPPVLMRRVMDELHCREILIGYGQTEASPLTHLTRAGDNIERRTTTVGINLPHQEVKVVDRDTGRTLPVGAEGEVCFRGYHIMRGYYGDGSATAEAIDSAGWLHSGDLGAMDDEGYLKITGRLKEMIIRGGENIYPREIEEFIYSHTAVAAVAVFGVADEFYGEELAAWVKLHSGASLSADELKDFCRDKIAHFKIPRYIRFVDEFPMTVTGKLQKFKMREIMEKELSLS